MVYTDRLGNVWEPDGDETDTRSVYRYGACRVCGASSDLRCGVCLSCAADRVRRDKARRLGERV